MPNSGDASGVPKQLPLLSPALVVAKSVSRHVRLYQTVYDIIC